MKYFSFKLQMHVGIEKVVVSFFTVINEVTFYIKFNGFFVNFSYYFVWKNGSI